MKQFVYIYGSNGMYHAIVCERNEKGSLLSYDNSITHKTLRGIIKLVSKKIGGSAVNYPTHIKPHSLFAAFRQRMRRYYNGELIFDKMEKVRHALNYSNDSKLVNSIMN